MLAVTACSGDKVLPEGKRIAVLSTVPEVATEITKGVKAVTVPAAENVLVWSQSDMNVQHLVPNLTVESEFKKQWSENFGKGSSKRDFLISKPLIADNVIYTLDADGIISAFSLNDGSKKWKTALEAENKYVHDTALKGVGLSLDNGTIFATTGYGEVYAVTADKGELKWHKSVGSPLRIAPMTADGKVFVQGADNHFYVLDAQNGEELWKYDISQEDTTMVGGAVPAYDSTYDVVITGFSNGEIQAFNAGYGTPLWSDVLVSNRLAYSSTFLNTIKAAPVIENGIAYVFGNANVLAAIDIRSGMRVWEKELGGINTPLVIGNAVYVVTNDNKLIALAKDSGDVLWSETIDLGNKAGKVSVFAPLMMNGRLVVTQSNGRVHTFAPENGKLLNTVDLDEDFNSAPVVADGYAVFVNTDADLIVYK